MCHNKNTIGEEGNEKPRHKIDFPRGELRSQSLVSVTLEMEYATQYLVQRSFDQWLRPTDGLNFISLEFHSHKRCRQTERRDQDAAR